MSQYKVVELEFENGVPWQLLKSIDTDRVIFSSISYHNMVTSCKLLEQNFNKLWLELDNNQIEFKVASVYDPIGD